jgi:hypothetical protein
MNMYLELTHNETEVLKRALSVRLVELRGELVRTDDREFRAELREELEILETIDRRLEGPMDVELSIAS